MTELLPYMRNLPDIPDKPDILEMLPLSRIPELQHAMEALQVRPWAEANILTENGRQLTFNERTWLRQIWDDPHPRIVIQKPTQVGATTWAYCRALHRAAVRGEVVIYTMPTAGDVVAFVTGRLNKVIDSSELLRQITGRTGRKATTSRPTDNAGLKHVGRGIIYFHGTITFRSAVSVPANVLIHDELDLSVPEVLEMYSHRLDAVPPRSRQIYELSTPTIPSFGINARFTASDARQWFVKCLTPGCKWEGPLDYWEHTGGHLTHLQCTRCSAALDPRVGRWVAEFPSRSSEGGGTHGYMLSRLLLVTPDERGAEQMQALHNRRQEARYQRHFYNMDLGLTSSEGTEQITREQLLGACFTETYPQLLAASEIDPGPYYMGIDQGDTLTVVIGRVDVKREPGRIRVVRLARLSDPSRGSAGWKQIGELMRQFQIRLCVIDGNPNSANAHDLARSFPGRALVCYYQEGLRAQIVEAADVRKRAEEGSRRPIPVTDRVDITVDRTESLDRTSSDLVGGAILLPSPYTHPDIEELMRHVANNVRRPEEKADGTLVYRWAKIGPNDYFHALNYLRVAVEEGKRLRQLRPHAPAPVMIAGIPTPR